jgi:hypothetical protein
MLTLTAIAEHGPYVTGFAHLWVKYVTGFAPSVHCARCLLGPFSQRVRPNAFPVNEPVELDEYGGYDYLYLCGVAKPYSWRNNLHLAVVPCPGHTAEAEAWNGVVFRIDGAMAVAIPELPIGYDGRTKAFTTCRNWRFGVSAYGLPAMPRA